MGSGRETWFVKNISNKQISIGDLPRLPTLSPNQRIDLLGFYTKEEIQQSEHLLITLERGWFRLTKVKDGTAEVVSASDAASETSPADQSDIGEATERLVARTLESLGDAGTTGEIGFFEGKFYGYTGSSWVSLMPSWSDLGL